MIKPLFASSVTLLAALGNSCAPWICGDLPVEVERRSSTTTTTLSNETPRREAEVSITAKELPIAGSSGRQHQLVLVGRVTSEGPLPRIRVSLVPEGEAEPQLEDEVPEDAGIASGAVAVVDETQRDVSLTQPILGECPKDVPVASCSRTETSVFRITALDDVTTDVVCEWSAVAHADLGYGCLKPADDALSLSLSISVEAQP